MLLATFSATWDSFDYIDADSPLCPTYSPGKRCPRDKCMNRSRSAGGALGCPEEARNSLMDGSPGQDPESPFTPRRRPLSPPTFNLVTLNIGGKRFQTHVETLERYPKTLLGNALRRQFYFNPNTNEYFFDRHRNSFEAIFYFYQSNGRMRRPPTVPLDVFLRELRFFEMGPDIIEIFWESEGYVKPPPEPLPDNKYLCMLWQLLEHPDTGPCARIFAFLSVSVIGLSIACFCLETIPSLRDQFQRNLTREDGTMEPEDPFEWHNPFFVIEFICIIWFTVEFVLRFSSCPSKKVFCKSFLNIIDVVAIIPFYVNLVIPSQEGSGTMSFAVLRVLRLVRVFRIFKLSRHSVGLQILGKTFVASIQELCLVLFFLFIGLVLFASAVYFAEASQPDTQFESIPAAFWYAIVTMTTVGYGDLVPKGPYGKLVGAACAIMGVLMLALPVPIIVSNFKHFYKQETSLARMSQEDSNDDDVMDNAADSDSSSSS